jgi:hypothetical protein
VYEANPAHSTQLMPDKTIEPGDAKSLFETGRTRVGMGMYIAVSNKGNVYQYFQHSEGRYHFAGTLTLDQAAQKFGGEPLLN